MKVLNLQINVIPGKQNDFSVQLNSTLKLTEEEKLILLIYCINKYSLLKLNHSMTKKTEDRRDQELVQSFSLNSL